jgi:hypothetical protein
MPDCGCHCMHMPERQSAKGMMLGDAHDGHCCTRRQEPARKVRNHLLPRASCPLMAHFTSGNVTLPANPFVAHLVDNKCKCVPPQGHKCVMSKTAHRFRQIWRNLGTRNSLLIRRWPRPQRTTCHHVQSHTIVPLLRISLQFGPCRLPAPHIGRMFCIQCVLRNCVSQGQ